ncbi:Oligo-1,6-glucosidase [compost metagenome]
MNSNFREINVASAVKDHDSIYNYYKKLIQLRKKHPVIVYGEYALLLEDHPEIYAYTRTLEDQRLLVILNFYEHEPVFELPADFAAGKQELLISNYPPAKEDDLTRLKLRPYEARVYLERQK